MAINPINSTTEVDLREFEKAVDRYAIKTKRGFNDAFKRAMVGIVRRAQAITPPASKNSARANAQPGSRRPVLTQEDKRRGESFLHADLMAVFSGTKTNGTRKAKAAALEDIERVHDRLFLKKIPGKIMRSDKPDGRKYEVDSSALARLEGKLKKRVGWVAAGFNAGCKALGVTPPSWVNNKSGSGSADVNLTGVSQHVTIINSGIPDKMLSELQRRVNWATRAQMKGMEREIKAIAEKTKL
jgi:hypothetical protein